MSHNMSGDIKELLKIMQQLRDPDTGCPWDVEQDFKSIVPYTIEEAYEVADAIQRHDLDDLKDELGDLLLQVVFHSQMASEQAAFDFGDVVNSICNKMIRRHPHVFAGASVKDSQTQSKNWEAIKAQERAVKQPSGSQNSILDSVPNNLPGLLRAKKLTKKAASVGFDWPNVESVLAKVDEELAELREAIASGDKEHVAEELGDLTFVMANVARKLDLDPDQSLRSANQKFIQRFHYIEDSLTAQGTSVKEASLETMDELWNEAKLNKLE